MAFWVHVEKGYTIFIVYFSSFKSLESLESLARLLEKVLKSCETFKIQDFANASTDPSENMAQPSLCVALICKESTCTALSNILLRKVIDFSPPSCL